MTRTRLAVWVAAIVLLGVAIVGSLDLLTGQDPGDLNVTVRSLGSAAVSVLVSAVADYFVVRPTATPSSPAD
ncbi:MAG: hypothetical protein K0R99_2889 [Microbacterium sp.]|jgi:hypothetical protein|uniref:hypothetical protein n=1 Tax=Microbacterium sp. TaxID=51671 RepID=UPI00260AF698|nr:hypothetical protein [Microbacterium sp.]MDF2561443.1 hypothetical protein [Microbacterium sp.]